MEATKKIWTKPVLIVIGRGTPEERVLAQCKSSLTGGPTIGAGAKCTGATNCNMSANS